jgi:small-conductance mechanosensitive channel
MSEFLGFYSQIESPWLRALIVVVASGILAQLAVWVLTRWISRLTQRTATSVDDLVLKRIRRPIFVHISVFGLKIAGGEILRPDHLRMLANLEALLETVTLFVWLGFAFSSLLLLLQSLSRHEHWVQPKTVPLLDNMGKLMIVALGGYALCLIWGVNATAWLTSAGILGIAIGFAAKDTLGNLFSGIFILADAPYKIGDFIILDNAERGQVTNIGLRSTRILTRDDIEIIIPNAVIAASKIVNETGGPHPKERIRVPVGVAYGSDVDRVVELLEKVALDNEAICRAPEPRARFRQFGTSSLDFELLCWIEEPVLRGQHRHELNMAVYKIFAKNGIQIPFPQRDIHIRTDVNRAED